MTDLLHRWTDLIVARGLRIAGIVLLAFILARLLRSAINRLTKTTSEPSPSRAARLHEQQTKTLAGILYSAGVAVIVAIAVLMTLREVGYDITLLAATAGLATVAVGIGAQTLVKDVINGFFIVFEDQYVVGDTIRIGTVEGRVEHLSLRRTVVRDADGSIVTILNGQIQQVANLSRDWAQVFLSVAIAPDTPVDPTLKTLEHVAAELRADTTWSGALVDGPRVLGVDSFGPAGVNVLIQVRTPPGRQDDITRELRRRILTQFEQDGVRTSGVQRVEWQYAGKQEGGQPDGTSHA
jgi:moderate conductance mechanosensitive channel